MTKAVHALAVVLLVCLGVRLAAYLVAPFIPFLIGALAISLVLVGLFGDRIGR